MTQTTQGRRMSTLDASYKKTCGNYGISIRECSVGFLVEIWSKIVGDFTNRILLVPFDGDQIVSGVDLYGSYLGDDMGAQIHRIGEMGMRGSYVIREGNRVE